MKKMNGRTVKQDIYFKKKILKSYKNHINTL